MADQVPHHLRDHVGRQRRAARAPTSSGIERRRRGSAEATRLRERRGAWGDGTYEERSPIDNDIVIGTFAQATRQDAEDAIAAAKASAPELGAHAVAGAGARSCDAPPTSSRERRNELAALMAIEVGKNRLEALGDVEETADLIRWYCDQMEEHDGFDVPDGQARTPSEHTERPAPVRRVGRHQPVQLPDGAAGGPVRRRARGRQHRRAQAVAPGRAASALQAATSAARRRRARRACSTWSPGRGATVGDDARGPTPTSTASRSPARTRSACDIYQPFAKRLPEAGRSARWAARTRRSSRRTPTWTRRPTA